MAEIHATRAATVLARHKMLSSVQGSGWHKSDPDERQRVERGQVPLAERPIAVADGDKIHLSGTSADIVRDGLKKFIDEFGEVDYGTAISEQSKRCCKEVLAESPAGDMVFAKNVWNACMFGLMEIAVHVVLTSMKPSKDEG